MAKESDVSEVANLLEKTKVAQVNLLTFKGRSLKLNSAEDGKNVTRTTFNHLLYAFQCFQVYFLDTVVVRR